ncbi:MAG TPA: DUF308 domain-containing protein [Bacillota bacterium]|nr:DUF308 domain-containing protein [Bacillota bacterium]
MRRTTFAIIVYLIIVLAVIGIVSQLMTSPGSFLKSILITIGIATILFGILYYVFIRRKTSHSNEMKKYKQAVKQSNAKYKESKHASLKREQTRKSPVKQSSNSKKKARRRSHLRVIDGYKDKEKDRANF